MKTLIILKSTVFVLTLLIIGGFAFVVFKITNNPKKINSFETVVTPEVFFDFSETAQTVVSCGEKLCLFTTGADNGPRVWVVDPTNGEKKIIPLGKKR